MAVFTATLAIQTTYLNYFLSFLYMSKLYINQCNKGFFCVFDVKMEFIKKCMFFDEVLYGNLEHNKVNFTVNNINIR